MGSKVRILVLAQMNSRVYFDYLDSLRFFAFLAVFIAHAGILFPVSSDWFYGLYRMVISHGAYGVNFFFVLSGFLITYLLLKEKKETSRIDVSFFYIKRILRIWPVDFVVFVISIFILPFIVRMFGAEHIAGSHETFVNMNMSTQPISAWLFAFFLGNVSLAYSISAIPFALGVLWSVSVEEQFYLVWPVIVKYVTQKSLFYISMLLFFASLIYRAVHINDANIAYYATLAVAMDLASGAMLGIVYFLYSKQATRYTYRTIRDRIRLQGGWLPVCKQLRTQLCAMLRTLLKLFFIKTQTSIPVHTRPAHIQVGSIAWFQLMFREQVSMYLPYILMIACAVIWIQNGIDIWTAGTGLQYDLLRLMKRPVLDLLFVCILIYFVSKGVDHQHKQSPDVLTQSLVAETKFITSSSHPAPSTVLAPVQDAQPIGLRHRPFTYLGRISYGLYAYHTIVIVLCLSIATSLGIGPNSITVPIFIVLFTASLAGTIYLSHMSYQYMEKRVLKFRSRYEK